MAVIGAVLHDPDQLAVVTELLQPDDFYHRMHRQVYAAIVRLYERDEVPDLVTVCAELRRTDELDDLGGVAQVSSIVNATVHIFNADKYATIVAQVADERRIYDAWSQALADIHGSDASQALATLAAVKARFQIVEERILTRTNAQQQQIVSLADLADMDLPEPNWAVEGILPEGFTLLAGDPKVGKSWMALQLGLSVAFGGPVFGTLAPANRGDVLGLFLEDSLRRIRDRSQVFLAPDETLPRNFDVFVEPLTMDAGGLAFLENWLRAHAQARLIMIDTVQRFRGFTSSGDGNMYSEDYEAMAKIQHLALSHHVAIVGLHHLNKTETSSPLRQISGSMGIAGGVDNTWILKRDSDQETGTLYLTGRDIDEATYALTFDKSSCQWRSLGSAREYSANQGERNILEYLHAQPWAVTPAQLARELNVKGDTMRSSLSRMLTKKLVTRDADGKYSALVY